MLGNKLKELNDFEDNLIIQFEESSFFVQYLPSLSWERINYVLLQRRFVSHIFTPVYDLVIDGFDDDDAKKIVKELIREEYGNANQLSHREELMHDLSKLGISKAAVLKTKPTEETLLFIQATFEIIHELSNNENPIFRNIGLLLMVRFWGEIIVSTEYKALWIRLSEFLNQENSRFYFQHYLHDQKIKPLYVSTSKGTHTDRTNILIQKYLAQDELAFDFFKEIEQKIFNIKSSFYSQFMHYF